MIDCDKRLAPGKAKGLCCRDTHHKRDGKPRLIRHRYRVDIVPANTSLRERLGYDRVYVFDMRPRGDFGNDATILFVQLCLRSHHRRPDGPSIGHYRCRRLVTTRFNSKYIYTTLLHNSDIS